MNIESTVSGIVLKVLVAPGDELRLDQDVVIIESMKMEIPVVAEITGTVDEILVLEGETIEEGDVLVSLKPV
jgi:biotin carboxyl carrier protein